MAVSLAANADGIARHGLWCRVRRNVDETEHGESLLLARNGQRMGLTRSRKPSPPAQGPVCKVQGGGVGWRFRAPARVWIHGASWGVVGVQGRSWPGSEADSFLPEPERCVKTPLVEAQSTAIARAMARICNDGQRCFGVQGGHGQKTLSLSGLPRAAVRCARWRLAVQVAANAVRGPQGGAIQVGHGLQAVRRRTGRPLRA